MSIKSKGKVAFIGLGVMGYPMAGYLQQKGYQVIHHSRQLYAQYQCPALFQHQGIGQIIDVFESLWLKVWVFKSSFQNLSNNL